MKSKIKYSLLLIIASLTFMACGESSTDPEEKEQEGTFYKLGKVTFEYDGQTTTIEDFYIDGLTTMEWSGTETQDNNIVTALFKAKDTTTSVSIGILGVDIEQNSLAGTYKVEDAKATAIFTWGDEGESLFSFISGDLVVEKMDKDGSVKLSIDGIGNYSFLPDFDKNKLNQPAKLTIDAKLKTVNLNRYK